MRWHQEKSLAATSREQEEARLRRNQEHARALAEEPMRIAAEAAHTQHVLNVLGRAFFLERFNVEPKIAGEAPFSDTYRSFTTPVFAIEYANLKFNPGKFGIHHIKHPLGFQYAGRSPFTGRVFRKCFSKDELKIINKHAPNMFEYSFDAAGICSDCHTWGRLGELRKRGKSLYIDHPSIETFGDVASNKELFNEAASGLALDCGTLPVFGFDTATVSTVIECPNVVSALSEENTRRATT